MVESDVGVINRPLGKYYSTKFVIRFVGKKKWYIHINNCKKKKTHFKDKNDCTKWYLGM